MVAVARRTEYSEEAKMIEILDLKNDAIAGLRIDGGVEKADVERAYAAFERQIQSGQTLRCYVEVANFGLRDMSLEAFLEDARAWLLTPGLALRPARMALVTDETWLTTVFEIECALIPTLTGAVFAPAEKDAALAWLQSEDSGAPLSELPAPPLSFSQLAQFGAIKGLGGLGVGLLVAGVLPARRRRVLGGLLLLGSVAASLPLMRQMFGRNEGA
jgi:hypothetical protein